MAIEPSHALGETSRYEPVLVEKCADALHRKDAIRDPDELAPGEQSEPLPGQPVGF